MCLLQERNQVLMRRKIIKAVLLKFCSGKHILRKRIRIADKVSWKILQIAHYRMQLADYCRIFTELCIRCTADKRTADL